MNLKTVMPNVDPVPHAPGTEGCGEGVDYKGEILDNKGTRGAIGKKTVALFKKQVTGIPKE